MLILNIFLLFVLVVVGVFISGWLTPLIIVIINRLLLIEIDPFMILAMCAVAAAVGDVLLWFFDGHIHTWLERRMKMKKQTQPVKKKKGFAYKFSHKIWEKLQHITNKKILLFSVGCASFSVIPDFFIVEFAREKLKLFHFVSVMFLGKFVVYAPLIWGSIGFIQLFEMYL